MVSDGPSIQARPARGDTGRRQLFCFFRAMKPGCRDCTHCAFCRMAEGEWLSFDRQNPAVALESGTVLVSEGERIAAVRLLCGGQAKLFLSHPEGRRYVWRIAEPGDAVGLIHLLSGEESPFTAVADGRCVVRFLSKPLIRQLLGQGDISRRLLRRLSRDLSATVAQLRELVLDRPSGYRLARLLYGISRGRADGGRPQNPIPIRMTSGEMAERIGVCRETVSRLIARLVNQGVLARKGNVVVIADPESLRNLVHQ
jgi:CRP/FNR family transcriptional regulator, cyclic AMP receptor protein